MLLFAVVFGLEKGSAQICTAPRLARVSAMSFGINCLRLQNHQSRVAFFQTKNHSK
jgi:hypothetical protein